MDILLCRVIVVVLLAGAAHAQQAPRTPDRDKLIASELKQAFDPPVAGQWVEGTWRPFRNMFCNQVQYWTADIVNAYVTMDVTMGKAPEACERAVRSFAVAGGALLSLQVMAMQFEASSTSLNKVDYEQFNFHGIKAWDNSSLDSVASTNCNTSNAEAHALLESRFAKVRSNLGDMPTVCGGDVDQSINFARSRAAVNADIAQGGFKESAPTQGPTPQKANITDACSQAGAFPSVLALGVVLRRRRSSSP
jgi:hypothetical protein